MKNQALFSSKDKSKKLKCRLLQLLFGALRVKRKKKHSNIFKLACPCCSTISRENLLAYYHMTVRHYKLIWVFGIMNPRGLMVKSGDS